MTRPTRIAFFSKKKSRTLYTHYIIRGLEREGARVFPIRYASVRRYLGKRIAHWLIYAYVRWKKIDRTIIFSGDIHHNTLDRIAARMPTALLLDDYFPVERDSSLMRKIRKVDVFIHTARGQLAEYRAAGAKRAVFIPSGVDPEYHRIVPPGPFFESDVAFIGKTGYDDRNTFVASIASEFDLAIYGAGWEAIGLPSRLDDAYVPNFRRICSSAKIVLGYDKSADYELYFSNRTWFVLGCGGFLLTRYVPGLEEMFSNHKHLVWYRSTDEAKELIRHYLAQPRERMRISGAGYRFAHEQYPFDRMAHEILRVIVDGEEPGPLTEPNDPTELSSPSGANEPRSLSKPNRGARRRPWSSNGRVSRHG